MDYDLQCMEHACGVLGVDVGVSRNHLNAVYLGLINRYSPAKVAGLGPEHTVLAIRRLAEVTAAFETVLGTLDEAA